MPSDNVRVRCINTCSDDSSCCISAYNIPKSIELRHLRLVSTEATIIFTAITINSGVPILVVVSVKNIKNILCQHVWHETGTNLEKWLIGG